MLGRERQVLKLTFNTSLFDFEVFKIMYNTLRTIYFWSPIALIFFLKSFPGKTFLKYI